MHLRSSRCALAAVLVTVLAGCGTAAAGPATAPEKTNLVVAVVPAEAAGGLYLAQDEGLFARAGLHVTIRSVSSSVDVIAAMLHGSVDVAGGQYAPFIEADADGIAKMRIIAAGYALGPHATEIMIGPKSPIRSLTQLKGKTIAVNAVNSEVSDLLYATIAPYRITPADVHVIALPFPAMPAALAAGKVSAIYETEPYVTEAAQTYGDQELADIDSGAAQNFPITGYAVTASWAARYPRTAAAFAKAIEAGNRIAATNLAALQHALETALHLPPQVVDLMASGTFPTLIDPVQLQRVALLMQQYGQLKTSFPVATITGP
jgi:NitT/TauT family transport system substrate-binding protein